MEDRKGVNLNKMSFVVTFFTNYSGKVVEFSYA